MDERTTWQAYAPPGRWRAAFASARPFFLACLLLGALCVLAVSPSGAQERPLAIRNARIYPVSGPVIEAGTILIREGKIAAVGKDVAVPAGARVIEAAGRVVMPGIVDANASFGIRGSANEQAAEVTPDVRAVRGFNPRAPVVRRALQAGVTSACLNPGSANVVGGLAGVVKTAGRSLEEVLVEDAVAIRAALGSDVSQGNGGFRTFGGGDGLTSIYSRRPNSRMAALWELRQALYKAGPYSALARAIRGQLPLRVHARIENDLRAALNVAEEFRLPRLMFDDAVEAYRIAELLAERKAAVVLGPFVDPQTFVPEVADACLNPAGLLAEKGVPVAFGSNGGDPTELRSWAVFAARNGLKPELALRAITLTAAELSGVADRVGSLDAGKDGDLLLLTGDPLSLTTQVDTVIVNGRIVHTETAPGKGTADVRR